MKNKILYLNTVIHFTAQNICPTLLLIFSIQDISGGSSLNLSQSLATGENIHSMDSVDLGFLGTSQQPDYLSYMSPSYSMSSMSSSSLSPCDYGNDGYTINISITDIDSQVYLTFLLISLFI